MQTIRVDFHCHSVYSDGTLTPREAADYLAADGVVVAALADHNSVEGLDEFRQALARREIGYIPAVEITTQIGDREAHLLAYGIDASHPELLQNITALRSAHPSGVYSVAETLRTKGSVAAETLVTTPDGRLDIIEAISLVHRVGGRAFLAHPLLLESDPTSLEEILTHLKKQGLDGIEAYYAPFSDEERELLLALARRLNLLVSAGSDLHDRKVMSSTGIDMPIEDWKAFRNSIGAWSAEQAKGVSSAPARNPGRFKWRNFLFHFIFPTLLAIGLFITAIYALFLPAFEQTLFERKREMIRELTNSAWSILAAFEKDEQNGRLSREEAQTLAISRIASIRYGKDGKDYFWLQDMHPKIIMHPYRTDLNGEDVSAFRDPRGVAIFVAFVELVTRRKEGYASYVWQWNDDPSRLVPKESYVKEFAPWGWIIGTGLYSEDVTEEIARIERNLVHTSLLITVIVVILLLYVMIESLKLERKRAEVEEELRESTDRYRSLVEATTEGTLLVIGNQCRYANQTFLEMLKCTQSEIELLDLTDLIPKITDNEAVWRQIEALQRGEEIGSGFDALLKRRDSAMVEVVLTIRGISLAGRDGCILHARSLSPNVYSAGSIETIKRDIARLRIIDESPVGIFRARASSRGTLLDYNHTAANLFSIRDDSAQSSIALADVFRDAEEYEAFLKVLNSEGSASQVIHHLDLALHPRALAIRAKMMRDEQGEPRSINGIVEDVTHQHRRETELETEIERLQSPLLFLHEPIGRVTRRALFCSMEAPVSQCAALMSDQQTSVAFVRAESGSVVGIITDSDIRDRVIAIGLEASTPVHRVMSAPVATVAERAVIYEALLQMEQRQINHLAVTDDAGRISGCVSLQELLQFQQYGPIVLTREIALAKSPGEVVKCCRRVPGLVRVMIDCGAHAHVINRLISSVADAATIRFAKFAEEEFGAPLVPYLLMTLGSAGRHEMTLASDQDNAIVYQPLKDSADNAVVEQHLLKLGSYTCEWLNLAGYPLCRGEVMASNPRWCQPLSNWKRYFSDWIERAEPKQLLEFSIFFDFYPLAGDARLAEELRRHLFGALRNSPAFYAHFAQDSLRFKPPKRLFGRILGGGKDQPGTLDVKEAIIPINSFARLYALRHGIDATNTLERLQRLAEADVLNEASYHAIVESYEFLMRLNLQHQVEKITASLPVDNIMHSRRLRQVEQTLLHQSFIQIEAIQKRVSYDFLAGME